jgi:hypothetical protein
MTTTDERKRQLQRCRERIVEYALQLARLEQNYAIDDKGCVALMSAHDAEYRAAGFDRLLKHEAKVLLALLSVDGHLEEG